MNNIEKTLSLSITKAFQELFNIHLPIEEINLRPTKKIFSGHYTFILFPYVKKVNKKPDEIGLSIGNYLKGNVKIVKNFNVVRGFLNIEITDKAWIDTLVEISADESFGIFTKNGEKVMIEYSSPNTNKPLHLGHLRNNFLGFSLAQIMENCGYEVMKTNLVNDRGIHICKSMLAYEKFGDKELPSKNLKGDKLVGNYYVKFEQEYKKQIDQLFKTYKKESSTIEDELLTKKAAKNAPLILEAQQMLKKWEQGDKAVRKLWDKMNKWVYEGFNLTYQHIGVSFDKIYYESQTYLLGKEIIQEGLKKDLFYKEADGSVWINLSRDGLDKKLLLRSDGTSVYITQDLGTADLKYNDFPMQKSIYVVGNEQDYHFKILQLIMEKLGRSYAKGIYHLSYGMVELPAGKMKSREGTSVDADDLVYNMIETARLRTADLGKISDFSSNEAEQLYHTLALGALKYYLLKVDSRKRILFNPDESIDFQGNTGVYIQYNFAKINAIIRKADKENVDYQPKAYQKITLLADIEIKIIVLLSKYPDKVKESSDTYSPALLANYAYDLSKIYSRFYNELPFFTEKNNNLVALRIALSVQVARVLKKTMALLGIQLPERM